MKYLRQFGIIVLISLLGEILNVLIPFPIPGSVYGLVILLICLMTGILKVSDVRETAAFLSEIMPVMFVPAAVGLLDSWDQLAPVFIPVIVIVVCSTILVMGVTGKVTEVIIHREKRKKHE